MYQKLLISEKIVQNITDLIIKGYYLPGDKLPNELVLSEELNVSRASLREAFKILESKHIIEVRRGKGTYIAAIPGLGEDPLGSAFFEFSDMSKDVFKVMSYIGQEICRAYQALDLDEKDLYYSFLTKNLVGTNALKRIFNSMTLIAKISKTTYLERMWQLHINMLKLNGVLESDIDFDVHLLAMANAAELGDVDQMIHIIDQVIEGLN